ncbi:MAG TPA: type II toxin-antitoxin system RelE/ParE family toxin [Tepidisphaeraceae bacterium]|jgi:phage-related protein
MGDALMHAKPLVWLHGEVKSPPFSPEARRLAGFCLRALQLGTHLSMPVSRPMPTIGRGCHELRIRDAKSGLIWRIVYRIDADAVLIGEVFEKKTQKTPQHVIESCRRRFNLYDQAR